MKKFILGILVGLIIGSCVVYAATYLYDATEVSYTPGDTSWKVSTVDAALNDIKAKSGSALTNLKNTNIAKAVSANGSTLTDVITKLGTIANRGNLTKTINPGGSVSLSAGYYSGGKITANPNQNSGTYTPSSHGTKLDMGANNTYRYVNTTNAYNQGYNAGKSSSGIKSVQRGSFTFTATGSRNVTISQVNTSRTLVIVTSVETNHHNNDNSISPRVTADLTSSTNITFRYSMFDERMNTTVHYQVIEFTDATVQRGALSGKTGCGSQNVAISSVNINKSFVILNGAYQSYGTVSRDNTAPAISGNLTSSNNLEIYWGSYSLSNPIFINWQVVTFP